MKKISAILSIFALSASFAFAQKTAWQLDASHSSVGFAVDHMVISETTGKFNDYSATVHSDKKDFSDAKIEVAIKIKSIDTDNEKRDGHLRSPDFFDADKYPTMTFKGTGLKKVSGKNYKLSGDLTIKGKTKRVVFDVKYNGTIVDPWGMTRAGFKLSTEIDRTEFGLTWNNVMETGGLVVGNDVTITCHIEITKKA